MPSARPPASASEALERAQGHARSAGIELLAALRALLDAAALGWSGRSSEAHTALRPLARSIDDAIERLENGWTGIPEPAMRAVLRALDLEVARWEQRSLDDAEARAVLRTFLGLRELLWEFGLRPGDTAAAPASPSTGEHGGSGDRRDAPRKRRVQRLEVQG